MEDIQSLHWQLLLLLRLLAMHVRRTVSSIWKLNTGHLFDLVSTILEYNFLCNFLSFPCLHRVQKAFGYRRFLHARWQLLLLWRLPAALWYAMSWLRGIRGGRCGGRLGENISSALLCLPHLRVSWVHCTSHHNRVLYAYCGGKVQYCYSMTSILYAVTMHMSVISSVMLLDHWTGTQVRVLRESQVSSVVVLQLTPSSSTCQHVFTLLPMLAHCRWYCYQAGGWM